MSKLKLTKKVNIMDKKAVIFYWPHNRPFMHDGDEFRRQAFACKQWYEDNGYSVDMREIPKGKAYVRRNYVMTILSQYAHNEIDRVIFLCHGAPKSFGAGFNTTNVHVLANYISRVAKSNATITLFSCLTGKKPVGGLAEVLSTDSGLRVFAHKTRGHTTRNPFKRVFFRGKMANLYPENREGMKELKKHFRTADDSFPIAFLEGFAVHQKGARTE
jgi:hypothetical protein